MKEIFKSKQIKYVLMLGLIALVFINVNRGVDFSDVGYNLSNYENFPNVNRMWMISTILSMMVGKVLTFLPFGHTMLFMDIYCALIVAFFECLIFVMLSKEFNPFLVFAGEALALFSAWCPYTILYHYLSYFLFAVAGLLLVKGLAINSNKKIALSGVILSLNVFVCFPNICGAVLGIIIIIDMVIEKKNRIKEILIFAGSYIGVLLAGVLGISIAFGKSAYIDMIKGLFKMSESVTSYSPLNTLAAAFEGFRWNYKYALMLIAVGVIGAVFFLLLKNKVLKGVMIGLSAIGALLVLRVMKYYGSFSFDYKDYSSYSSIALVVIMLSLLVAFICLFDSKYSVYERLVSVLVPLTVLITPLGSNNGIYKLLCALFVIYPVTLGILMKKENRLLGAVPFRVTLAVIFAALLFQSVLFKFSFSYGDVQTEYVKITKDENVTLAGMKTSASKKEVISGLTEFLNDNGFTGKEAIIFGHIPMASYAFSLSNAVSHVWPSLDSYPYGDFEKELNGLSDNPILVYYSEYGNLLTKDYSECFTKKEIALCEYLRSRNYKVIYSNSFFTVCSAD